MSRAHGWLGWAGVVAFLVSGLWMHFGHDHLAGLPDDRRMVFRACHLAILFAALVNLALGWGATPAPGWRSRVAASGSALVLAAPVLLGIAFLVEPGVTGLDRPWTRFGVFATAGGVLLHAIARAGAGPEDPRPA